jgi:hypothetical protein
MLSSSIERPIRRVGGEVYGNQTIQAYRGRDRQ